MRDVADRRTNIKDGGNTATWFRSSPLRGCSSASYLSHDVSLTPSVTVLLQIARVPSASSAVRHLAGRVADRQAALEVHRQLRKALRDTIAIK